MSVIDIQDITKDYGESRGVFNLSFSVNSGEVLGFLGPNGAGKTTTIRQLLGFSRPDKGKLTIMGMDCFLEADKIHKDLGYLPGEIAFIDAMKATEFIRFVAKMKNMSDLGRAHELMKLFELDADGKIEKMSKGMKQKIGIVCAFMQDPQILILDEPTSGLDPLMQNKFIELILAEKKRGKTILMSSHMFEEIEKTCDRAVIIRQGQLVAIEQIEKLRQTKKKVIEIRFATELMARQFANSIKSAKQTDKIVVAEVEDINAFIKRAADMTVSDINVRNQSLEEFFLHFYGGRDD